MTDVKQKWVVITGAASGIGYECALAFAKRGSHIVATDINLQALERVKADIERLGARVEIAQLNVTQRAEFDQVIQSLKEQGIEIDILLNNAGLGWLGSIEEHTTAQWKLTLDVNLMGVVNGTQAVLKDFKASINAKHIVNIASLAAIGPATNISAYVASKAAVMGFTDVLGMECLATNVNVTCVHPGVINTPIVNSQDKGESISDQQLARLQQYYVQHGTAPEVVAKDIVNAVLANKARLYTGANARLTAVLKRLLPSRWMWILCHFFSIKIGYAK